MIVRQCLYSVAIASYTHIIYLVNQYDEYSNQWGEHNVKLDFKKYDHMTCKKSRVICIYKFDLDCSLDNDIVSYERMRTNLQLNSVHMIIMWIL